MEPAWAAPKFPPANSLLGGGGSRDDLGRVRQYSSGRTPTASQAGGVQLGYLGEY